MLQNLSLFLIIPTVSKGLINLSKKLDTAKFRKITIIISPIFSE